MHIDKYKREDGYYDENEIFYLQCPHCPRELGRVTTTGLLTKDLTFSDGTHPKPGSRPVFYCQDHGRVTPREIRIVD